MALPSIVVSFDLLRHHPHFRWIFIARLLSVLSFGLLVVAVPVQIHAITQSTLQVGMAVALDAIGTFVGLLLGGVLADRHDRRRLILAARLLCGLGYGVLALNSFAAMPSVTALYLLALWDGFFGAIGMTALMAVTPGLVGRERLPEAAALNMLIVRFGAVLAPALGGLLIAAAGVEWNYALAALGTLGTLLPLWRLPRLGPPAGEPEHPVQALTSGFRFLFGNRVVAAVVVIGTLESLANALRVLFPALAATHYGGGAVEVGLMYAAVPAGALIGAFTSGWVCQVRRPGLVMVGSALAAFGAILLVGLLEQLSLGLVALLFYGYVGSIGSLLQLTIVQSYTPDHLLGRINSLWTAQDVIGDSLGAFGLGLLGRVVAPGLAAITFGGGALLIGLLLAGLFAAPLRRAAIGQAAPELAEGGAARRTEGTAAAEMK